MQFSVHIDAQYLEYTPFAKNPTVHGNFLQHNVCKKKFTIIEQKTIIMNLNI